MASIIFNPEGNVNLQLKVETPENLTTTQRKIVDAFFSGASFCYQGSVGSNVDQITGNHEVITYFGARIGDNIMDSGYKGINISIFDFQEADDLIPLVEEDKQIIIPKDENTIVETIPVKLIPYINGKKATKDVVPYLNYIDEYDVYINLTKFKTKETDQSPAYITSNFTVLDSKNQEHTVHYNIYIINGKEDLINTELTTVLNSFSILGFKQERIVQFSFSADAEEQEYYSLNSEMLIDNEKITVKKCFNLIGDVDIEEELLENKFSYLQFRLADNDMNDLSINNENYEFQTQGGDEIAIVLDVIPNNK